MDGGYQPMAAADDASGGSVSQQARKEIKMKKIKHIKSLVQQYIHLFPELKKKEKELFPELEGGSVSPRENTPLLVDEPMLERGRLKEGNFSSSYMYAQLSMVESVVGGLGSCEHILVFCQYLAGFVVMPLYCALYARFLGDFNALVAFEAFLIRVFVFILWSFWETIWKFLFGGAAVTLEYHYVEEGKTRIFHIFCVVLSIGHFLCYPLFLLHLSRWEETSQRYQAGFYDVLLSEIALPLGVSLYASNEWALTRKDDKASAREGRENFHEKLMRYDRCEKAVTYVDKNGDTTVTYVNKNGDTTEMGLPLVVEVDVQDLPETLRPIGTTGRDEKLYIPAFGIDDKIVKHRNTKPIRLRDLPRLYVWGGGRHCRFVGKEDDLDDPDDPEFQLPQTDRVLVLAPYEPYTVKQEKNPPDTEEKNPPDTAAASTNSAAAPANSAAAAEKPVTPPLTHACCFEITAKNENIMKRGDLERMQRADALRRLDEVVPREKNCVQRLFFDVHKKIAQCADCEDLGDLTRDDLPEEVHKEVQKVIEVHKAMKAEVSKDWSQLDCGLDAFGWGQRLVDKGKKCTTVMCLTMRKCVGFTCLIYLALVLVSCVALYDYSYLHLKFQAYTSTSNATLSDDTAIKRYPDVCGLNQESMKNLEDFTCVAPLRRPHGERYDRVMKNGFEGFYNRGGGPHDPLRMREIPCYNSKYTSDAESDFTHEIRKVQGSVMGSWFPVVWQVGSQKNMSQLTHLTNQNGNEMAILARQSCNVEILKDRIEWFEGIGFAQIDDTNGTVDRCNALVGTAGKRNAEILRLPTGKYHNGFDYSEGREWYAKRPEETNEYEAHHVHLKKLKCTGPGLRIQKTTQIWNLDMSELWPTAELWPEDFFRKHCHWKAGDLECHLQNLEAYLAEDGNGDEYLVWNHDSICGGNPRDMKGGSRDLCVWRRNIGRGRALSLEAYRQSVHFGLNSITCAAGFAPEDDPKLGRGGHSDGLLKQRKKKWYWRNGFVWLFMKSLKPAWIFSGFLHQIFAIGCAVALIPLFEASSTVDKVNQLVTLLKIRAGTAYERQAQLTYRLLEVRSELSTLGSLTYDQSHVVTEYPELELAVFPVLPMMEKSGGKERRYRKPRLYHSDSQSSTNSSPRAKNSSTESSSTEPPPIIVHVDKSEHVPIDWSWWLSTNIGATIKVAYAFEMYKPLLSFVVFCVGTALLGTLIKLLMKEEVKSSAKPGMSRDLALSLYVLSDGLYFGVCLLVTVIVGARINENIHKGLDQIGDEYPHLGEEVADMEVATEYLRKQKYRLAFFGVPFNGTALKAYASSFGVTVVTLAMQFSTTSAFLGKIK